MNILKFYYRIILFYFITLLTSGVMLESYLAFPGLFNERFNSYSTLKLLHQNVFEYGIFFNIFSVIVLLYNYTYKIKNRRIIYFFWLFQSGIFLEIMGNTLIAIQNLLYIYFEWLAVIFIVFSIVLFIIETHNFYLYNLEGSDSLIINKKLGTNAKLQYNSEKNYVWNYYILIPLVTFLPLFILKQTVVSGLIYSTFIFSLPNLYEFTSNITVISYEIYIYNYFLINILSGIFYLSILPDRNKVEKINVTKFNYIVLIIMQSAQIILQNFLTLLIQQFYTIKKVKVLNEKNGNHKIFLNQINGLIQTKSSINNFIQKNTILLLFKIQWILVTFIFLLILFFKIQYYMYREYVTLFEKLSILFIPLMYFVTFTCIRFISKQFIDNEPLKGLMNFAFMFFTLFVLAEIITCLPNFQNTFMFSDWIVSQRHLFLSGYFLPVFYVFVIKSHSRIKNLNQLNKNILQNKDKHFEQVQSVHRTFKNHLNTRFWTLLWWFFTLSLTISGWVIGVMEAGLWNKMDGAGYLEYPGWIGMISILRPFRIVRFFFFLILILFIIILFVYNRKIIKKKIFNESVY